MEKSDYTQQLHNLMDAGQQSSDQSSQSAAPSQSSAPAPKPKSQQSVPHFSASSDTGDQQASGSSNSNVKVAESILLGMSGSDSSSSSSAPVQSSQPEPSSSSNQEIPDPPEDKDTGATVTSDAGKMIERHQDMIDQAEGRPAHQRREKIRQTAEVPRPRKTLHLKRPKRQQIPGLNVSPLHKLIRWSIEKNHYVRQTHMEPITRNGKIIRRRVMSYNNAQVRIPEPLLIELRAHYLHSTTLSMSQMRHFTNQDLLILSVLPAFNSDVQQALVDALGKPDGVLKKLYEAQVNQVNSLSNRKLLISINDKLDANRRIMQRSRGTQRGFFHRFETVLFAIFRLLGYLFAGQFNQQSDLNNTRRIVHSGNRSEKIKAYITALQSDYVDPALRAAYQTGSDERQREATIQQTTRQSKNRHGKK